MVDVLYFLQILLWVVKGIFFSLFSAYFKHSFYVQYLHKIIKKMCFWGNENAKRALKKSLKAKHKKSGWGMLERHEAPSQRQCGTSFYTPPPFSSSKLLYHVTVFKWESRDFKGVWSKSISGMMRRSGNRKNDEDFCIWILTVTYLHKDYSFLCCLLLCVILLRTNVNVF